MKKEKAQTTQVDLRLGGKGRRLTELNDAGFPVPRFIVLPVKLMEGFLAADGQPDEAALRAFCDREAAAWKAEIGAGPYAVRSSAVAEDGRDHSFAGQFRSLLNVAAADLPQALAEVLRSAASPQVAAYLKAGGGSAELKMAVILQEMVPATAAGVAFGVHPVTGDPKQTVINAVGGLGDKLVEGTVNGDQYILRDGLLLEQQTVNAEPVLAADQLSEVTRVLQALNPDGQQPQDMEFAFAGNRFFLLQARPVTALKQSGERIAWDNSNIVESYPGLTLPLTFSFIEKMYEAVYRQFAAVLGVPKRKIEAAEAVYANMLGLLNGRVYYNLNSWYAALAQLPGYSLNAAFMEKMMGVREKPDIPSPSTDSGGRLGAWLEVAGAAAGMLRSLRRARSENARFRRSFDSVYNRFATDNLFTLSPYEVWARYRQFEQLMVREWRAPLANDLFAMIYFGSLQKFCAKHVPGITDLQNRLLAGWGAVATTEPLRRLPQLAAILHRSAELRRIALDGSPEALWEALQEPAHRKAGKAVQDYLAEWGERCVAELKLETITYQQEPVRLMSVLQAFVRQGNTKPPAEDDAAAVRERAEAILFAALRGKPGARLLARHLLRQARYFVANRENLRYYRTRGFGMVRKMMLALGRGFTRNASLQQPGDVFYLTLSEVEALVRQPKPVHELVRQRREDYEVYEALPLPQRLYTQGPPSLPLLQPQVAAQVATAGSPVLQGLGCSPGTVRGVVRKVRHAGALSSVGGGILTTYATDPGYTILFATAGGILTERGSLLSHAAIVSREMGLPCVVAVDGLMDQLRDGDTILMDGSSGIVKILERAPV